jgi:hypothetical protein
MGTLHANRASYETKGLSFSGMPETSNGPEEADNLVCTFTLDVIESGLHDLRAYILGSFSTGFGGSVQHGHVAFDFAQARLAEPLSERDWASHSMRIVFQTPRNFITNLRRPIGQIARDPADDWFQALYVLGQDKDLWRRRRLEWTKAAADLDEHRLALEAAEGAIATRLEVLLAGGTDDLRAQARQRGWQ